MGHQQFVLHGKKAFVLTSRISLSNLFRGYQLGMHVSNRGMHVSKTLTKKDARSYFFRSNDQFFIIISLTYFNLDKYLNKIIIVEVGVTILSSDLFFLVYT